MNFIQINSVFGVGMQVFLQCLEVECTGRHKWAVSINQCQIDQPDDPLLLAAVESVKDAYGFPELEKIISDIGVDSSIKETINLDSFMECLKGGLPNPASEGSKPDQLKNYRSETCELVARRAASAIFEFDTPSALQSVKGQPNQPMLGYDGWGLVSLSGSEVALVLIQVKGSNEEKSPPSVIKDLIQECKDLTVDIEKIKRTLCAVLRLVGNTPFASKIVGLMNVVGAGRIPKIIAVPTIVRGSHVAQKADLRPLLEEVDSIGTEAVYGLTISLGAELNEFCRKVLEVARSS